MFVKKINRSSYILSVKKKKIIFDKIVEYIKKRNLYP